MRGQDGVSTEGIGEIVMVDARTVVFLAVDGEFEVVSDGDSEGLDVVAKVGRFPGSEASVMLESFEEFSNVDALPVPEATVGGDGVFNVVAHGLLRVAGSGLLPWLFIVRFACVEFIVRGIDCGPVVLILSGLNRCGGSAFYPCRDTPRKSRDNQ
jgi:hypothetical protein